MTENKSKIQADDQAAPTIPPHAPNLVKSKVTPTVQDKENKAEKGKCTGEEAHKPAAEARKAHGLIPQDMEAGTEPQR